MRIPKEFSPEYIANCYREELFNDDNAIEAAHKHACVHLKLDPDRTMVGGNESDLVDNFCHQQKFTIIESDPRHELYWSYVSAFFVEVISKMLAGAQMAHPEVEYTE